MESGDKLGQSKIRSPLGKGGMEEGSASSLLRDDCTLSVDPWDGKLSTEWILELNGY